MGDMDALEALREAKTDEQKLALERALLRPTVFPLEDEDEDSDADR